MRPIRGLAIAVSCNWLNRNGPGSKPKKSFQEIPWVHNSHMNNDKKIQTRWMQRSSDKTLQLCRVPIRNGGEEESAFTINPLWVFTKIIFY